MSAPDNIEIKDLSISFDVTSTFSLSSEEFQHLDSFANHFDAAKISSLAESIGDASKRHQYLYALMCILYSKGSYHACVALANAPLLKDFQDVLFTALHCFSCCRLDDPKGARDSFVRLVVVLQAAIKPESRTQFSEARVVLWASEVLSATDESSLPFQVMMRCGREVARLGEMEHLAQTNLSDVSELIRSFPESYEDGGLSKFSAICTFLGTDVAKSMRWRETIFNELILPFMEVCLEQDQLDNILIFEKWMYRHLVTEWETESKTSEFYLPLQPIVEAAGHTYGREIGPLKVNAADTTSPIRIAFIFHNLNYLSHVEGVVEVLEAVSAHKPGIFEAIAIHLENSVSPVVRARLDAVGAQVRHVPQKTVGGASKEDALALREACRDMQADVSIWVGPLPFLCFAFAFGLTRHQIHLSTKFKTVSPTYATGRLAFSSVVEPLKRYGSLNWRMLRMYLPNLYDASAGSEASDVRNKLSSFRLITGCIGRVQKIRSSEFLSAVVELLQSNLDVCFVWTGRKKDAQIQQAFVEGGVADRTFFVGWIDTRVYAQVLDVFLDSFPFPCGRTATEAMAAGTPVLYFRSEEALATGVIMTVDSLFRGEVEPNDDAAKILNMFESSPSEPLMPIATDKEHYVELGNKLISDAVYRDRVGEAQKTFAMEFLMNAESTAEVFETHIRAILAAEP